MSSGITDHERAAIASTVGEALTHVKRDSLTENGATNPVDELVGNMVGDLFRSYGDTSTFLSVESGVQKALAQSDAIMAATEDLVTEALSLPEEQHSALLEGVPDLPNVLEAALKNILTYPEELTTQKFKDALQLAEESTAQNMVVDIEAKSRVAASRHRVGELTTQLKGPNDAMKTSLEERRAQLDERRRRLEERKANMQENVRSTLQEYKTTVLKSHTNLEELRESNRLKRERIREIKSRVWDIQANASSEQNEQNAFMADGSALVASYAENRIAIYKRLQNEVLPALASDAESLKLAIREVTAKNNAILAEGRRELTLKRERIRSTLTTQTSRLAGLSNTFAILEEENRQVKEVTMAQTKQHTDSIRRLEVLKKGLPMRKYHVTAAGKSALRYVQLSRDAVFLRYAADPHYRKKVKTYRVANIAHIFIGPVTSTFHKMQLHKDDTPSATFSIVFKDNETLDFAVPPSRVMKTAAEFKRLSAEEQRHYRRVGKHYEADFSLENYEDVVIGLHELVSMYDTQKPPQLTPERLRWMRLLIASMFARELRPYQRYVARKHLRRMFGYEYFETQFEMIQARTDNIFAMSERVIPSLSSEVPSLKTSLESLGRISRPTPTTPGNGTKVPPAPQSVSPSEEDLSAPSGISSTQLRQQFHKSANFSERIPNIDELLKSGLTAEQFLDSVAEESAMRPLASLLDLVDEEVKEDDKHKIALDELETGMYRFSCDASLELLDCFSLHKQSVAVAMVNSLTDPQNFETVVKQKGFQEYERDFALPS